MGSCIRFGAVSGNWGHGKRRIGESVCVCVCVAVWRQIGRRKESYNMGVPT